MPGLLRVASPHLEERATSALMRFAHCHRRISSLLSQVEVAGQGPAISIAGIGLSFQGPRGGSGAVPRGAFSRRGALPCQKQFLEKAPTHGGLGLKTKSIGHTCSNPARFGGSVQRFERGFAPERVDWGMGEAFRRRRAVAAIPDCVGACAWRAPSGAAARLAWEAHPTLPWQFATAPWGRRSATLSTGDGHSHPRGAVAQLSLGE